MSLARIPLAAAFVLFLAAGSAQSQHEDHFSIAPWEDPADCSYFAFGTPALPTLPADFFGPGSDPFEGQICVGRCIGAPPYCGTPAHDIEVTFGREGAPSDPGDPPGTVIWLGDDIRSELCMGASQFVNVCYSDPTHCDQFVVRFETPGPGPFVPMSMVEKTHQNGGIYDVVVPFHLCFTFTRVSDGQEFVFDTELEGLPPLELHLTGVPWVHESDPALALAAPDEGLFVPGVEEIVPGDLSSQCPVRFEAIEPSGAMRLVLQPSRLEHVPDAFLLVEGAEPDGSEIVFGPGDNPEIPPEFFGPGSEPFSGPLPFKNNPPLIPKPKTDPPETTASAIWGPERVADWPCLPADPIRTCAGDTLILTAGGLDPIEVTYSAGPPELWDVQMDLPLTAPGAVTRTFESTHANGGTYTMELTGNPVYTFTRIGDGQELTLDTNGLYPPLVFTATDGYWVRSLDPALNLYAPNEGMWVLGVEEEAPGDPASQVVRSLHLVEASGAGQLTLAPIGMSVSAVNTPRAVSLRSRAYPNPFNPGTRIEYVLADPGPVRVEVFNVRGERVRVLRAAIEPAGERVAHWDGMDAKGAAVPTGVYFYRVSTRQGAATGKITLLK